MPYSLKTGTGNQKRNVKKRDKPETAAQYLEDTVWAKREQEPEFKRERIINEDLDYNIGDITLDEIRKTIKKFKRRMLQEFNGVVVTFA